MPTGRARWTLELLADALVKLTPHESLSRETVRRRLAENHLKPWRKDMWCIPQIDADYVARKKAPPRMTQSASTQTDDHDVIGADGLAIGRVFRATTAPAGTPWMWTLACGERQDHGHEPTRETAMQACRPPPLHGHGPPSRVSRDPGFLPLPEAA